MGPTRVEDLSLSFVRDDGERRLEFGRQLAGYVRRHRERWDITAVLEPVQLLGSKTGEVNVHLHRCAQGQLAVTIQFQLGPAGPQTAACGQRANARNPFREDYLKVPILFRRARRMYSLADMHSPLRRA